VERLGTLHRPWLAEREPVGWGKERTPTLCHRNGKMLYDAGARGLKAASIFST